MQLVWSQAATKLPPVAYSFVELDNNATLAIEETHVDGCLGEDICPQDIFDKNVTTNVISIWK